MTVQSVEGAAYSRFAQYFVWQWSVAAAGLGAGLLFCSVAQDIARAAEWTSNYVWLLDVDAEVAFFTWLSIVALFVNAVLLAGIASFRNVSGAGAATPWFLLAAGFVALSVDEFSGLHERLSGEVNKVIGGSGAFAYGWVVPALALLGVVGAIMLPWLKRLPQRFAIQAVGAGAVYVAGAVGCEMASGYLFGVGHHMSLPYRLLCNLEEGLELSGTIAFAAILGAWLPTLTERTEQP